MKSIIQDEKKCFITNSTVGLDEHHCIPGTANRKNSEMYGLKVWLRHDIHMRLHDMGENDLYIRQTAQQHWEDTYGTRDEFIRIFGRSWL